MSAHILRLRRTDKTHQHLLVRVERQGSKQLDLKLIGTEHEHLYHAQIQETTVKSLQSSNYAGDLQEWRAILAYALLHERSGGGALPDFLHGIETVAAISGKTLTITLRKNIGGITQRLGSIKLEQDDEPEVSAFEWVDSAVATADDLRTQLETLQASVSGQQEEVAKLSKQLDELVQAKKDHEDEMLQKFAALLNAKKLKIRDQQRLLAGSKIDSRAARDVRNARDKSHVAGGSRVGKRKAVETDENEHSDGVEGEDAEKEVDEDEEMQQETPAASDDEATDDEDDLDAPLPRQKAPEVKVDGAMARRDMPLAPAQVNDDDDVDDETDDEL